MTILVKVMALKPQGGHKLWIQFSDGTSGKWDFAPLIALGGEMITPLRDPTFFAKAYIAFGVPCWPNGFDVDAINLHMDMSAAGALSVSVAA